jgi:hypothetical protein
MGLHPDKSITDWKCHNLKVHLVHALASSLLVHSILRGGGVLFFLVIVMLPGNCGSLQLAWAEREYCIVCCWTRTSSYFIIWTMDSLNVCHFNTIISLKNSSLQTRREQWCKLLLKSHQNGSVNKTDTQ